MYFIDIYVCENRFPQYIHSRETWRNEKNRTVNKHKGRSDYFCVARSAYNVHYCPEPINGTVLFPPPGLSATYLLNISNLHGRLPPNDITKKSQVCSLYYLCSKYTPNRTFDIEVMNRVSSTNARKVLIMGRPINFRY